MSFKDFRKCTDSDFRFYPLRHELKMRDVGLLKDRDYVLRLSNELTEKHQTDSEEKHEERRLQECARIVRLMQQKLISLEEIAKDSCVSNSDKIKFSEWTLPVGRCPSPSLIMDGDNTEIGCDTSVFFRCVTDERSSIIRQSMADEMNQKFDAPIHFADPVLQQLFQEENVDRMYELAESVLSHATEGCKALIASM